MAKKKKLLKKLAKAALIGGALYGGSKLLKGAKGNVSKTAANEDININVNPLKKWSPSVGGTDYVPRRKKWTGDQRMVDNNPMYRGGGIAKRGKGQALRGGGIAKRGMGRAFSKGGKV